MNVNFFQTTILRKVSDKIEYYIERSSTVNKVNFTWYRHVTAVFPTQELTARSPLSSVGTYNRNDISNC